MADVVVGADPQQYASAEALARRLSMNWAGSGPHPGQTVLWVGATRTELRIPEGDSHRALVVDYLGGALGNRLRRFNSKEPLVRAVGSRSTRNCSVLDATPGFGRDAVLLAMAGYRVTMVERVPALVALLEDGVTRARDQLERQAGRSLRLRIELGDSLAWIHSAPVDDMPQIIYLDPMFPSRSKSALVKLDMRLLRRIAGVAGDVCRLFETAMRSADRRVVVKRPRGAPCLCGTKPDFEIDGSGVRFDVYLTNASQ